MVMDFSVGISCGCVMFKVEGYVSCERMTLLVLIEGGLILILLKS